jgi:hypothetical protein
MMPTIKFWAQTAGSINRLRLRRSLTALLTSSLLLMVVIGSSTRSLASRKSGVRRQLTTTQFQRSQMLGGANTCKCLPPINSEASATGTCTRTQDDGSFCELTFSLSQKAAVVSQLPTFDSYAMASKFSISKENIRPLVDRLQAGEIIGLKPEDVAASNQAVAAVAAFQRPNDAAAQSHFQDIFQMLTFHEPTDPNRSAPVLRSMDHFAADSGSGTPEIEKTSAPSGRTYELVTTPGCIAFGENQFSFMVRATGAAATCDGIPR